MPIKVKCLASGSTGNSYAVDDGESVLLLEAGVNCKRILSGYLDLLPRVAGCLVTHEHQDHARSAAGLAGSGIDLYMTAGTFGGVEDRCGKIEQPYRIHIIQAGKQFGLASWIVLPFQTEHDAAEPVGYLLYSRAAREKLLFATDTYFIPNTFRGLNVVMVECNYSLPLLEENVREGRIPASMKPRLMRSHFGLENVKDFLRANDVRTVRHIYLLHISHNNGDPELFQREIQRLTGKPVTAFYWPSHSESG
jgi:phosphoribosyl 1,2-cyclic phosphodiesterase